MDTQPALRLHLRTRSDLLGAVPYLIGHHPTDSIVAVALADRLVPILMSTQLPLDVPETAAAFLRLLHQRPDVTSVLLIGYGYGSDDLDLPVLETASRLADAGLHLVDLIYLLPDLTPEQARQVAGRQSLAVHPPTFALPVTAAVTTTVQAVARQSSTSVAL